MDLRKYVSINSSCQDTLSIQSVSTHQGMHAMIFMNQIHQNIRLAMLTAPLAGLFELVLATNHQTLPEWRIETREKSRIFLWKPRALQEQTRKFLLHSKGREFYSWWIVCNFSDNPDFNCSISLIVGFGLRKKNLCNWPSWADICTVFCIDCKFVARLGVLP